MKCYDENKRREALKKEEEKRRSEEEERQKEESSKKKEENVEKVGMAAEMERLLSAEKIRANDLEIRLRLKETEMLNQAKKNDMQLKEKDDIIVKKDAEIKNLQIALREKDEELERLRLLARSAASPVCSIWVENIFSDFFCFFLT